MTKRLHEAQHDDHSKSNVWIAAGLFLGFLALVLALIIDLSSPNSGGRAIAVLKGLLLGILIGILIGLLLVFFLLYLGAASADVSPFIYTLF